MSGDEALVEAVAVVWHDSRHGLGVAHNDGGSEPFAVPVVPCGWCRKRAAQIVRVFTKQGLVLHENKGECYVGDQLPRASR